MVYYLWAHMNLFIFPDKKGLLEEKIPERLSQFFEQYRGFGQESEVAQLQEILGIDLSVYQRWTLDNSKYPDWILLDEIHTATRILAEELNEKPEAVRSVQHNGIPHADFKTEFLRAQMKKDSKRIGELIKRWQSTPDSAFPPDTGYIRSPDFVQEITGLLKIFTYLTDMHCEKVRLLYR